MEGTWASFTLTSTSTVGHISSSQPFSSLWCKTLVCITITGSYDMIWANNQTQVLLASCFPDCFTYLSFIAISTNGIIVITVPQRSALLRFTQSSRSYLKWVILYPQAAGFCLNVHLIIRFLFLLSFFFGRWLSWLPFSLSLATL